MIEWNHDCQGEFDKIKQYFQDTSVLIPPVTGRPLIMYLTVLNESMGCMLDQHDETGRKEHAIYYLSKKFSDYETRYSLLGKTCCETIYYLNSDVLYKRNYDMVLLKCLDKHEADLIITEIHEDSFDIHTKQTCNGEEGPQSRLLLFDDGN